MKVRVYVEGGPKGAHTDGLRRFKNSFKKHLMRLDLRLQNLDVSPCGSASEAIRDYARASRNNEPDYAIALLVDSDSPVTAESPAMHLQSALDSAKVPQRARASIFLMVQCMESWLVTDLAALEKCFGPIVGEIDFPKHVDIEAVPKKDVFAALDNAARQTPTRHYHKVRDGARILAELEPRNVARRSRHARDLHAFLRRSLQA